METTVLLKFLRHLMDCTETVLGKEEIDHFDLVSLQRELSQLKRHIDGKEQVDPVILDKILGLRIHVDESLLSDSKQSMLFSLLRLLFHRSPLLAAERSRRLEEAKRQITQFKEDLDHLRFAIEF